MAQIIDILASSPRLETLSLRCDVSAQPLPQPAGICLPNLTDLELMYLGRDTCTYFLNNIKSPPCLSFKVSAGIWDSDPNVFVPSINPFRFQPPPSGTLDLLLAERLFRIILRDSGTSMFTVKLRGPQPTQLLRALADILKGTFRRLDTHLRLWYSIPHDTLPDLMSLADLFKVTSIAFHQLKTSDNQVLEFLRHPEDVEGRTRWRFPQLRDFVVRCPYGTLESLKKTMAARRVARINGTDAGLVPFASLRLGRDMVASEDERKAFEVFTGAYGCQVTWES